MNQSSVIHGSDTKKMMKQCIFLFKRGSMPFDDSSWALNFSSYFKPILRSNASMNVFQIIDNRQHRRLIISRYQVWHFIKRQDPNNYLYTFTNGHAFFQKRGDSLDRNLNKWRISAELLTNELTFHSLIFCMKNRSEEIVEVFHVTSHSFLATLATRFNNRKEGLF